jgi:hypothetical protein
VPVPGSNDLTARFPNHVRNAISKACLFLRDGTLPILGGSTFSLENVIFDNDGYTVTPGLFTIPRNGLYLFSGSFFLENSEGSQVLGTLISNDSGVLCETMVYRPDGVELPPGIVMSGVFPLSKGDTVWMGGGCLDVPDADFLYATLSIVDLGADVQGVGD